MEGGHPPLFVNPNEEPSWLGVHHLKREGIEDGIAVIGEAVVPVCHGDAILHPESIKSVTEELRLFPGWKFQDDAPCLGAGLFQDFPDFHVMYHR